MQLSPVAAAPVITVKIEEVVKVDFKKLLPSKEEVRRKNYIGDSIIAERDDEHEEEVPHLSNNDPLTTIEQLPITV